MSPRGRRGAGEPRLITGPFLTLVTGHFLQALGFASMPLLPLYLGHLEATRTEIGVVMALPAVGGLVARPLIGWSLDVVGRRTTILVGTVAAAAGAAGIGAVTRIGPLLVVDRLLFGVGAATLFTGYMTYAADLIPESRRTEGIALFGISGLIPLALNPLVGQMDLAPAQIRWVFPCVGAIVALSAAAALRLPELGRGGGDGAVYHPVQVLRTLRRPALMPVWWITVVFATPVALVLAFATVTAEERELGNPAWIFLTYAAGATLVRAVGGRLPDRLGPRNLVAPSVGMSLLAMVVVAHAGTSWAFLLAGVLGGLGHGYAFPVMISQVVARTPLRHRGTAMATFTALFDVASLCCTPAFGRVADRLGDAVMFTSAALAVLAGLAAWAALEHWLGPRTPTASPAPPPPGPAPGTG